MPIVYRTGVIPEAPILRHASRPAGRCNLRGIVFDKRGFDERGQDSRPMSGMKG